MQTQVRVLHNLVPTSLLPYCYHFNLSRYHGQIQSCPWKLMFFAIICNHLLISLQYGSMEEGSDPLLQLFNEFPKMRVCEGPVRGVRGGEKTLLWTMTCRFLSLVILQSFVVVFCNLNVCFAFWSNLIYDIQRPIQKVSNLRRRPLLILWSKKILSSTIMSLTGTHICRSRLSSRLTSPAGGINWRRRYFADTS